MTDLLAPIEGDDPCGPDLRWDQDFLGLDQVMDAARKGAEISAVDAEVAAQDGPTWADIIASAEGLCARTKDVRVFTIYAEAKWRAEGLGGFADAMELTVKAIETYPGHTQGIHPRADPDDGDLQERAAPLGKLLNAIPVLASTLEWGEGERPAISRRTEIAETLEGVFSVWSDRLGEAVGADLQSANAAWSAISKLVASELAGGDASPSDDAPAKGGGGQVGDGSDAWDLIEHAAEQMAKQDRHSPALPMLRLMVVWRDQSLVEIANNMKQSGVSLEQVLESIRRQLEAS